MDPRDRAAPMGDDPEQSRLCPLGTWPAREWDGNAHQGGRGLSQALTVFDKERSPYYWQGTQGNLNKALALVAERQAQAGASLGK
jgi:hypothetical protein